MASKDNQNVWFGIAMFLVGLIAGVVLMFGLGAKPSLQPIAPGTTAPKAAQAPSESVNEKMLRIADDIGVDTDAFESCLESGKFDEKIASEQAAGQSAGVSGTPGNILLDLRTGKAVLVSGAKPFPSFKEVIDAMLSGTALPAGDGVVNVDALPPLDFEKDHLRGSDSGKVAIFEYSDFECPFCRNVHATYEKIVETYGDDVVWVYRHFPLSFHPEALPLAVGSECAAEQGGNDAFWKFADALFE